MTAFDFAVLNNPYIALLIIGLAIWRLSFLMVSEDGAFSITFAIRLIFAYEVITPNVSKWEVWKNSLLPAGSVGHRNDIQYIAKNHFGKLIGCIMCTSMWVAGFAVLGMFWWQILAVKLFYLWMAFSGLAVIIHKKGFK